MHPEAGNLVSILEVKGSIVALYEGPVIAREQDALDAIGACYGRDVDLLALPAERLAEDFFRLKTGLAGAVLQKFRNYGLRVAVVGDISRWANQSGALRDFVVESNRGGQVLFVSAVDDLEGRL